MQNISNNVAENFSNLNQQFEKKTIPERLHLIFDVFGDDVGMTSAFGYSGMVLMYHLKEIKPDIPIYFIDTRFHFKETLKLVEEVKKDWKLNIISISTSLSEKKIEQNIGFEAYKQDPDLCCNVRKVEPLIEILPTKKIWLHALRRDQSILREKLNFFEPSLDVTKAYPLADWTREQCWDFIIKKSLKYNPLHDEHYPSIGCIHCTKSISKGESERAGRWSSFPEKTECGLHILKAKKENIK